MPLQCVAAGCEQQVPRDWERHRAVADKLRQEARDVVEAAEARAQELVANAERIEGECAAHEQADDFPLCLRHHDFLSFETAGLLLNTAGADPAVRAPIHARARAEIARRRPRSVGLGVARPDRKASA